MSMITVITSGKGGVGKTTMSVGIGSALARRGARVLLIDMENGLRGLERVIGVDETLVFDASDIVNGKCNPMDAIYPCLTVAGLFMLPAPSKTEEGLSKEQFKRLVSLLSPYFDQILIDCPAGIAKEFAVSVCAAQRALVVVNPDPIGVRCAKPVRDLLKNEGISDIRLIINRFDADAFLEYEYYPDLDAVIDDAGIRLIAVIPEDFNLMKAAAKGVPCAAGLPSTMAFDRLSARLCGENIPVII